MLHPFFVRPAGICGRRPAVRNQCQPLATSEQPGPNLDNLENPDFLDCPNL